MSSLRSKKSQFVGIVPQIATAFSLEPAYTSQECSNCGEVLKKFLFTRTHTCKCGCVMDRDHNAAINIVDTKQDSNRVDDLALIVANRSCRSLVHMMWRDRCYQR
jgi:transposase